MTAILAASALLCSTAAAQPRHDPLAPTGRWTAPVNPGAATPPMGWNSYNAFRIEVSEDKVIGSAQALVRTGLAKLGYRYVTIDDGWWLKRRTSDGRLMIRTAIFPSAAVAGGDASFRAFTDRLHAMGLKAGIYSDIGRNACSQAWNLRSPNLPEGDVAEREIGLEDHVDRDIRLFFRDWGFDFIKVDACGVADYGADARLVAAGRYRARAPLIVRDRPSADDATQQRLRYAEVAAAIRRYAPGGDAVLSICNWGRGDVRSWGNRVGAMWQTSDDIAPTWSSILHNFDSAAGRALYARPGAWNDPDMLFVGTGDFDANHLTEARSHFAMWAMIAAPLIIGYDLRTAPRSLLDIWGNADLIAVNQDAAGHQATLAYRSSDVQIWVKTLSSGRKAVALFNRGATPAKATLTAAHLKASDRTPVTLRDLWGGERSRVFTASTAVTLAPHETIVFEAQAVPRLGAGVYLSEIPGRIHVAADGVTVSEPDPSIHQYARGDTRSDGAWPSYGGWGGAQVDASPYGTRLAIGRTGFADGIGILSGSRMEVRAERAYRRFAARVGVDVASRDRSGRVRFAVYADGRLVRATAPLRYGAAPVAIDADVTGARVVELVARRDGGAAPAAVAWAEARFLK